ncbi:MAG: HPr family phosphocarrier protein [Pseudomonadales bacterium]|nr:HPr family phosphocarrier protein [Pseudomonadales bacterium]
MIEKSITIINKLGLHARAAAKLVAQASQFSSSIKLSNKGSFVDSKSIMSVLMLAAAKGSELKIIIEGEDEEQALEAIETLINNRFDEEE